MYDVKSNVRIINYSRFCQNHVCSQCSQGVIQVIHVLFHSAIFRLGTVFSPALYADKQCLPGTRADPLPSLSHHREPFDCARKDLELRPRFMTRQLLRE
jgi:hypothetical protein